MFFSHWLFIFRLTIFFDKIGLNQGLQYSLHIDTKLSCRNLNLKPQKGIVCSKPGYAWGCEGQKLSKWTRSICSSYTNLSKEGHHHLTWDHLDGSGLVIFLLRYISPRCLHSWMSRQDFFSLSYLILTVLHRFIGCHCYSAKGQRMSKNDIICQQTFFSVKTIDNVIRIQLLIIRFLEMILAS